MPRRKNYKKSETPKSAEEPLVGNTETPKISLRFVGKSVMDLVFYHETGGYGVMHVNPGTSFMVPDIPQNRNQVKIYTSHNLLKSQP